MKTYRCKITDIDKNFLADEATFYLEKAKWWEGRFSSLRWFFSKKSEIKTDYLRIHR